MMIVEHIIEKRGVIVIEVFFSHQHPNNPISHVIADRNMNEHQMWLTLIDDEEHDVVSLQLELMRQTGMNRAEVNHGFNAISAMNNLPELRALQEQHFHLNMAYVSRIMTAVARADKELWPELDRRIANRLTPRTHNEVMIQAHDLAGLITRWIKELDPEFDQNTDRGQREEYLRIEYRNGMAEVRGRFSTITGHHLEEAVRKAGGLPELLEQQAPRQITLNVYQPQEGGLSWIPGVGYFDCEFEQPQKKVDLDCYANKVEMNYRPSEALAKYVRARDGHCRMPGCRVPADQCQIDHILPWGEGGLTVAWNLQCLCQHHHNAKTDERFGAEMNSLGEVTWIGPMKQPMVTAPIGPLAPVMPTGTWGQTLRSRMEARFNRIRESAIARYSHEGEVITGKLR